jgi:hypothetical protein
VRSLNLFHVHTGISRICVRHDGAPVGTSTRPTADGPEGRHDFCRAEITRVFHAVETLTVPGRPARTDPRGGVRMAPIGGAKYPQAPGADFGQQARIDGFPATRNLGA